MRKRFALAALPLLLALPLATSSSAKGLKPQIVDSVGDTMLPLKGMDIVSVTYDTAGTSAKKKVGKKFVTVYTPKDLVITLKTDAAVDATPGAAFWIDLVTPCGLISLQHAATVDGGIDWVSSDCADVPDGSFGDVGGSVVVAGNTITFTASLKGLGTSLKVGTKVTGLHAYSDLEDPLIAAFGPGYLLGDEAAMDSASSDATWKVG